MLDGNRRLKTGILLICVMFNLQLFPSLLLASWNELAKFAVEIILYIVASS